MDGVTIGHPCCSVHNCRVPLTSKLDHFCPVRASKAHICRIVDPPCNKPAIPPYRSCDTPEHRAADIASSGRGKSVFQLKNRLQRTRISHVSDSVWIDPVDDNAANSDVDDEAVNRFAEAQCPSKPESGNKRVRARWTRRQTHNEQPIVRPCGVIVSRTTMFGPW